MASILLITHEPLGPVIAGPAIRTIEIAAALADIVQPTIATPYPITRPMPRGVTGVTYRFDRPESLIPLAEQADAMLLQGFTLFKFPPLADLATPMIVDLYCPFQLENLERLRGSHIPGAQANQAAALDLEALHGQLRRGDFFVCANERQRDLWLGMLMAEGRISPDAYGHDPDARQLIDIVPFGLPTAPPERSAPAVKGVIPGIAAADRLLVWGGSVLEWQDPETLVDAIDLIRRRLPNVRLVLPGGPHPNPEVPEMPVLARTKARARALGLLDTHVFFGPWIPYDRRADYLLEADLGVSTHRPTLETRFAWRTRMLDYLWATLPIVCTAGDSFADLVSAEGLGAAVPPGDPSVLAAAALDLLEHPDRLEACRVRLAAIRERFTWPVVIEPLRQFAASPHRHPSSRSSAAEGSGSAPHSPRGRLATLRKLLAR